MGVTKNYNRDKDPKINVTGLALTAKADEGSTPTPADLAGDDGIIHFEFEVDADESGGVSLVNMFKGTLEVSISSEGRIRLLVNVTEVQGDATEVAQDEIEIVHSQTADAWQAAAGRAQQP